MRKELPRPARPASSGTRSATCRASGRASVLMSDDLVLDRPRAARRAAPRGACCSSPRRPPRARRRPASAPSGGRTVLSSAWSVNANARAASMIAAGERQPEREAERTRGRVHAGGLADPLLRDRRQRVVVQLRDEQAEPGAGDEQRERRGPARRPRAGTTGMSTTMPIVDQREADPDDRCSGRRWPARFPARRATANMLSDSGASDRPASIASYSRTICRKIGRAIISAAEGDLLEHLPGDAEPERRRPEQVGVEQRRLALHACGGRSHQTSAASATAPSAISAPTASPPSCHTRMPSTMPPMPTTDSTAPTTSIGAWSGVRHVLDQLDAAEHDDDDRAPRGGRPTRHDR